MYGLGNCSKGKPMFSPFSAFPPSYELTILFTAFGSIGHPIRRKEDARLLTGKGRFTDDFSIEGQTYALEGEEVDLAGPLRDNLLLELPSTVLCREECAGLCPACGADRNTTDCGCDLTVPDPRWDALRDLEIT